MSEHSHYTPPLADMAFVLEHWLNAPADWQRMPAFAALEKVRAEWVIRIDGRVKARDESLVNAKIPTGEIEVYVTEVEVLGAAYELPLPVFGDTEYPEETRLTYRFLDLRR